MRPRSPDWENVVEHTPEKGMRRYAVHINEEHEQRAAQGLPAARKRPISLSISDGMEGQVVTHPQKHHSQTTPREIKNKNMPERFWYRRTERTR